MLLGLVGNYAKDKNGEYYRGEKIRENRGIKQDKFQKNDIKKTGIEKKKRIICRARNLLYLKEIIEKRKGQI